MVDFSGGRNLLVIADVDTLVMDLSLVLIGWAMYRRRAALQGRLPFVAFAVMLSLLTAVLLGYVVTNFGTLFRLRYLVAAPVWASILAVGSVRNIGSSSTDRWARAR